MSSQTSLRDLDRNNVNTVADRRTTAMKKGAAPPPRRPAQKAAAAVASNTGSKATVTATFISPPRNPPTSNASADTTSATAAKKAEHEEAMLSGVHTPYSSHSIASTQPENDYGVAAVTAAATRTCDSGVNMAAAPQSMMHAMQQYVAAAYAAGVVAAAPRARGTGLRSVSAVPVLSLGRQEERQREAASAMNSAPMTQPHVLPYMSSLSPQDDVVAVFLATCVGHVTEAACTPHGKALLMAALETQRREVLVPVVAEVCTALHDVAVDPHGCHVLRTLVEACSAEQTEELIQAMYPSAILNICTTSQHTRLTLQSLFERRLVDLGPIVNVLAANAGYLAATQQGCISLMRVFERCDVEQKAQLVHELLPKFAALSMDAFANYMVQCAIDHSDRTTAAQYVITCFAGHLLQMSCDKFSSNVVEKVVKVCGEVPAVRRLLLDELIFNPAALKELVFDGYGNFVVQSIVEATTNAMELKRVEDRLRPAIVGCPFAARIEAKLKAKRPAPQHGHLGAGNGSGSGSGMSHHNHHNGQQQQRHVPCLVPNNGNAYAAATTTTAPPHPQPVHHQAGSMPMRSSSYRAEADGSMTESMSNSNSNTSSGYRHRPYEPRHVSAVRAAATAADRITNATATTAAVVPCFQDPNVRAIGDAAPNGKSAQVRPAAYFHFPILSARNGSDVENVDDVENSGPVYGPSPAARRHLQQQSQQFCPPFNGTL